MSGVARTTITLLPDLLRTLKIREAEKGMATKELVTDLLRGGLATRSAPAKKPFTWKTTSGHKLLPGVDLNDRNASWEIMDGRR